MLCNIPIMYRAQVQTTNTFSKIYVKTRPSNTKTRISASALAPTSQCYLSNSQKPAIAPPLPMDDTTAFQSTKQQTDRRRRRQRHMNKNPNISSSSLIIRKYEYRVQHTNISALPLTKKRQAGAAENRQILTKFCLAFCCCPTTFSFKP